jgi:hypothetical protein
MNDELKAGYSLLATEQEQPTMRSTTKDTHRSQRIHDIIGGERTPKEFNGVVEIPPGFVNYGLDATKELD